MASYEELDTYLSCMQIMPEIVRGIVHGFVHVQTAPKSVGIHQI
jgi:hypothetical protein